MGATWVELAPELDAGYKTTFARLSRIFRSRGFTTQDADDLAQEAVVRTLAHLDRHGRRAGDLTPLLNTIAKNLVVERFRTGGRELPVQIDDRLPDDNDPSDEVVVRDRAAFVRAAINELPARQRTAVLLWLDGDGPAQIAAALGLNRNAADALLHRARRQLAAKLEDVRASVWGVGSLAWLRIREAARKVATLVVPADPGGLLPQLLAGVATFLLLAGAPAITDERPSIGGFRSSPASTTSFARSTAGRSIPEQAVRPKTGSIAQGGQPYEPGVRVGVAEHRVEVVTYPAGGSPLGLITYHERDPEDRGITGPLLDQGTELICSTAPEVCF